MHEAGEYRELLRRESELRGAAARPAAGEIHPQVPGAQDGPSVGTRASPAQQGAEPGEEDDGGERLDEVVVGAGVQPLGLVVLAVLRGEHQHGRLHPRCAQGGADPVTVQTGEHEVQHDHHVIAGQGAFQSQPPVDDELDAVALGDQPTAQGGAELGIVLDNQDAVHASKTCTRFSRIPEGDL